MSDEKPSTETFATLAHLLKEAIPAAHETRRRLWVARDEVTRLETLLAAARASLAAAECEDERTEAFTREMFGHLKREHESLGGDQ